jgi:hypothetical protein
MPIYFSCFITALLSVSGDLDNLTLPQCGRLFILRAIVQSPVFVSYPETWITGESQMEQTADFSAALAFVIDRIEQEAMRSGEPLNEEERFLLNNLPTVSTAPEINIGDPEVPLPSIPRDRTYERLCVLAKAARRNDVQLNPASLDWDFAFAVAKLSHHPLLALAMGGSETAEAMAGPMATDCRCPTCHRCGCVLNVPRDRPTLVIVALDNRRCRIHRDSAFYVFCFPTNRTTTVEAKRSELQEHVTFCKHVGTLTVEISPYVHVPSSFKRFRFEVNRKRSKFECNDLVTTTRWKCVRWSGRVL